ncbi:sigma-70 family RNA polymerase sigma factor [Cryobacterium sp. TMT2-4]|uniref:sigma-70 family RNA polymerase sigma factor n=1 Tax=Cryobacterium sp. TMT2-4 TaxID=1259254 RepID=UPI00106C6C45|nr:sigma-70 family RNA polymerase sigma factor [Cryobacterium sp. TMT2-4]TFC67800.1 sigma-70 family RNA polymerase sigma factor [Cryobacterium sp. TMT2-4]
MTSGLSRLDHVNEIEIVDREPLIVDPSVLGAIGLSHSLSSAIADLIDNSLDAGASDISIRFLVEDSHVMGLHIRDDGAGMTAAQLKRAFGLAVKREYQDGALGHFGMGMKSSSMSQAKVLTVYSRCGFEEPVARSLRRHDAGGDGYVDVLSDRAAWDGFDRAFDRRIVSNGTIVEWLGLDTVSNAHDDSTRRAWLGKTIVELRQTLGLTFHRLLAAGDIRIEIEQYDTTLNRAGAPSTVVPLDPFAFHLSGKTGYPKEISAITSSGGRMIATCHILPPNASGPAARLLGERRPHWQGLYLYRNNRLLQASGWHSLLSDASDVQLARVAIDLTDDLLPDVALSPDKNGVVLRPGFIDAIETARNAAGETGFRSFLDDARGAMQQANRRAAQVKPVTEVKSGLPADVLATIETELRHREDARPITIKWRQLEPGQVFWVDHAARALWLNAGYRRRLSGSGAGLLGDASLLKSALFLLLEEYFAKERLVQSALDQIDAWHSVLAAAMAASFDVTVIEADEPEDEVADEDIVDVFDPEEEAKNEPSANAASAGSAGKFGVVRTTPRDTEPLAEIEATEESTGQDEDGESEQDHRLDPSNSDDDFTPQPGLEHVVVSLDPVRDYRVKASETPLLTADEEVALARRIEIGLFAQDRIAVATDMSRLARRELDWVALDGHRAQAQMFGANMRLVMSLAARYQGQGLDFLDLVQEGNLGLLRAIEKFDFKLGYKFSTYATWWVRQGITRGLADQSRTIRVPVHMVEQIHRLQKIKRDLESTTSSAASLEEIATAAGSTVDEVRTVLRFDLEPRSLNDLMLADDDLGGLVWTPLGDLIEDDEAQSAEDLVGALMLEDQLERLLDFFLSEREAGVIRMRFGLGDIQPKTLDQIGDIFGVTRERIRQIEKKTMVKLRDPAFSSSLRDFLDDGLFSVGQEVKEGREAFLLRVGAAPEIDGASPGEASASSRPSPANVLMPSSVRWATRREVEAPAKVSPASEVPAARTPWQPADITDVTDATADSDEASSPAVPADQISSQPDSAPWWKKAGIMDLPIVRPTDTLLLEGLHNGGSIAEIAHAAGFEDHDVAIRLGELLFGLAGDLDVADLAPRHGHLYEPDERDRMVWEFRSGINVERIAANFGRTVLAVVWQLLDNPLRPVTIPKRLRKAARRMAL